MKNYICKSAHGIPTPGILKSFSKKKRGYQPVSGKSSIGFEAAPSTSIGREAAEVFDEVRELSVDAPEFIIGTIGAKARGRVKANPGEANPGEANPEEANPGGANPGGANPGVCTSWGAPEGSPTNP
jgi:hypothetical protein